jgi:hypothetical protein
MHAAVIKTIEVKHKTERTAHHLPFRDRHSAIEELGRLLDSRHFRASRRCSDFLEFIVRQALDGNWSTLKERTLGVELFNRQANYDTNSDPVVRATAGEVRKKMAQYYQETNSGNIHIVLPVGTYVPQFEVRSELSSALGPQEAEIQYESTSRVAHPEMDSTAQSRLPMSKRLFLVIALPLVAVLFSAVYLGMRHLSKASELSQRDQTDSAIASFWGPFAESEWDTVAVFSEVGSRSGSHQMAGDSRPIALYSGGLASPGISGVGEVAAVHALDGVFSSFHHDLRVKRSNFFTFDDAVNENVIFLGSPLANPPVRLLEGSRDFVFQVIGSDAGRPVLAILNNQPHPGEPKQFLSTPGNLPIKEDYAVIALLPGLRPGKRVLILAGITTFGTQAATEFVSQNDSLKLLLSHLKRSHDGELEPFEAVISVKIDDEVPVNENIVALHLK